MKEVVVKLYQQAPPLLEKGADDISWISSFVGPKLASLKPFISSPATFAGTRYAQHLILDEMEREAVEVVKLAAEGATNDEQSDDD